MKKILFKLSNSLLSISEMKTIKGGYEVGGVETCGVQCGGGTGCSGSTDKCTKCLSDGSVYRCTRPL